MVQAYCMKCRKKVEVRNPSDVILKNNRPAISGTCPVCGTKVFRVGTGSLLLRDVPQDKVFWCNDGRVVKNLSELVVALQQMSDETYSHHVTGDKNDFSNWVRDVIGDVNLARDMQKAVGHNSAAKTVETRLARLGAEK